MPSCSPEELAERPAPYRPPAWELGAPPAWPYVSKRLDVAWLPNEPLWASPVLTLGPNEMRVCSDLELPAGPPIGQAVGQVAYYRLTPAVLAWLDAAGRALESRYEAGACDREQVDAYCDAMPRLWQFAAGHLDPNACARAKDGPAELPEAPFAR